TLLYGLFYVVADWAAKRECPTMLVHLESGKETASMRLLLPCDARSFELNAELKAAIVSAGGVFSMKDLDGAFGISLTLTRGDRDDG
ncbi:MAG: hypothetical protein ACOYI4_03295, partial [Christensenellales bacterium]